MSPLAELPALVGFFSYSREDDDGSGGKLSKLRERIQEELRSQLGRSKADFRLWQDKTAIAHGKLWEDEIKSAIAESVFFIPIITPTAVRSHYCKFEFDSFLAREKELGRRDLVFPILYIPVPALTGERWRQDPLLAVIGSRQYEQWQNLRQLDPSSTEVALRIEKFCANICRTLEQELDQAKPSHARQSNGELSDDELIKRYGGHDDQPPINFESAQVTLRTIIDRHRFKKDGDTDFEAAKALFSIIRLLSCKYHPPPISKRICERVSNVIDDPNSPARKLPEWDDVHRVLSYVAILCFFRSK
jgi:hypothetical protein